MKRMASGAKSSRSSDSSSTRRSLPTHRRGRHYVLCVKNKGYPASLERGKLYRVLLDHNAETHLMRRIVDESGEDYLYPRDYFVELPLPAAAKRALSSISR